MGFADKSPRKLWVIFDRNKKPIVRHLAPALDEPGNDFYKLHKTPEGIWRCNHCWRKWEDEIVQRAIQQAPRIEDGKIVWRL